MNAVTTRTCPEIKCVAPPLPCPNNVEPVAELSPNGCRTCAKCPCRPIFCPAASNVCPDGTEPVSRDDENNCQISCPHCSEPVMEYFYGSEESDRLSK